MLTWFLVFIAALAVLLVSSKFFTGAAEKIGLQLGFSPFVIGVFIIGIGTSLPELISGFIAVSKGASEIVAGNVLGANISNIFLISGIAAVLAKKRIDLGSQYIMIDLHFMLGSAFLLGLMMLDGKIDTGEGVFLLAAFATYTLYILRSGNKAQVIVDGVEKPKNKGMAKHILVLLACGVGIYFGADYTVMAIENIATIMAVPPSVISLTALSLGTTLPELSVNISAIRQGKAEMAIGNVLGSCVFNALAIPGAASLMGGIAVPQSLLVFSLPVMVIASLFFYLLTLDKKISPYEGLLFIVFYGFFLYKVGSSVI
jgi:cation:H+ antiporter